MKKLILFITLFFSGVLLVFVSSLVGCATKQGIFVYTGVNFRVEKLANSDTGTNYLLKEMDTCHFDSLQLYVGAEASYIMTNNFNFGSQAFAYKPHEPVYKAIEQIEDLKIVLLEDYNSSYPKGSNIAEECSFKIIGNEESLTKGELIDQQRGNDNINQYSNTFGAYIVFPEKPAHGGQQQFAIELRIGQNAVLRDTSTLFILLP